MHFTREEKHGHSANSVTVHSPFFLRRKHRGRKERSSDKRQEDVRCIRGVTQATCLWASAWWYGMASSSSGAILSMSAWFSRLNTQQQGREGGRESGQEKSRELCVYSEQQPVM